MKAPHETPGYSGTPLARKLGIKPPMTVLAINAPTEYPAWLGELPDGVCLTSKPVTPLRAVHLFVLSRSDLEKQLAKLRKQLEQTGFLWVSWPKKAARISTDLTENVIRDVALPLGFVDIKICAVSDVWSGLKLVIRKSERSTPHG